MKKQILIWGLLICTLTNYAQQTTIFKHMSEDEIDNYEYSIHMPDFSGCEEGEISDSIVFIEIAGINPTASFEEKQKRISEIDTIITCLESYGKCTATHTIIIHVGEALFLTEEDKIEIYSKKYYRKGRQINAERFWKYYQSRLEKWLPGKTIIYVDLGW